MADATPSAENIFQNANTEIEVNLQKEVSYTPVGKHKVKRLQLKKFPKWKSDINKSLNRSLNKSRTLRAISSSNRDSSSTASFVKWSLRSNNRALAQSLEQAKKELRLMNEVNLKLQMQNMKLKQSVQSGRPYIDGTMIEDKLREDVDILVEQKLQVKLNDLKIALSKPSMLLLEAGQCINNIMDQCLQSKKALTEDIKNNCSNLILSNGTVTSTDASVKRKQPAGFGSPKRVLRSDIPPESPPTENASPPAITTIMETPESTQTLNSRRETFVVPPPVLNRRETFAVAPQKDGDLVTSATGVTSSVVLDTKKSTTVMDMSPPNTTEIKDKRKTFCLPKKKSFSFDDEEGILEQNLPNFDDLPDSPNTFNHEIKSTEKISEKGANCVIDPNHTMYMNQDMDVTEVINFNPIQDDPVTRPSAKLSAKKADRFMKPSSISNFSVKTKSKIETSKSGSKVHKTLNSVMLQIKDNKGETTSGASVALSRPKPGKIVFAASRKDINGSRKTPNSKLPTKTHSKDKRLTEKSTLHVPVKSVFDFHDKTPDLRKIKSVYDLSLDESLPQDQIKSDNSKTKTKLHPGGENKLNNKKSLEKQKSSVSDEKTEKNPHKQSLEKMNEKVSPKSNATENLEKSLKNRKSSDTYVGKNKNCNVTSDIAITSSPVIVTDGENIIHCFPLGDVREAVTLDINKEMKDNVTAVNSEPNIKKKSMPSDQSDKDNRTVSAANKQVITNDGCIMYSLPMKKDDSEEESSSQKSKNSQQPSSRSRSRSRSRKSVKNEDKIEHINKDNETKSLTHPNSRQQTDKANNKSNFGHSESPLCKSDDDETPVIHPSRRSRLSRKNYIHDSDDDSDFASKKSAEKNSKSRGRSKSRHKNFECDSEGEKNLRNTRSKSRPRKKLSDDFNADENTTKATTKNELTHDNDLSEENTEKKKKLSEVRRESDMKQNESRERSDNCQKKRSQSQHRKASHNTDSVDPPEKLLIQEKSRGRSRSRRRLVSDRTDECEGSTVPSKMTRSKSRARKDNSDVTDDVKPKKREKSRGRSRTRKVERDHSEEREECKNLKMTRSKSQHRKDCKGDFDNGEQDKLTNCLKHKQPSISKHEESDDDMFELIGVSTKTSIVSDPSNQHITETEDDKEIAFNRKSRKKSNFVFELSEDDEPASNSSDRKTIDKLKTRGRSKSRPREKTTEKDKNSKRERSGRSKSRPRSSSKSENVEKQSNLLSDKEESSTRKSTFIFDLTDDYESTSSSNDRKNIDKLKTRGRSKSRPREKATEKGENSSKKRSVRSKSRPRSPSQNENVERESNLLSAKEKSSTGDLLKSQNKENAGNAIFKMPVKKDFKKLDTDVDVTLRSRQVEEKKVVETSFTNFDSILENSSASFVTATQKVDTHAFLKAIKSKSAQSDLSQAHSNTNQKQETEPKVDSLKFLKAIRSASEKQTDADQSKKSTSDAFMSKTDLSKISESNDKQTRNSSSGRVSSAQSSGIPDTLKLTDHSGNSVKLNTSAKTYAFDSSSSTDDTHKVKRRKMDDDSSELSNRLSRDNSSDQSMASSSNKLEELKRKLSLLKQANKMESPETDRLKNDDMKKSKERESFSCRNEKENKIPNESTEEPLIKRSRRAATNKVSYAEPKLGGKLRRGDPFTSNLFQVPIYKSPTKNSDNP